MAPLDPEQLSFDRESFSGVARLFPVPNLVVYPHVMQPLHIFEERYREMLEDAIADDRLIAMAVLAPGWEIDYASRPELLPWACLGKVVTHHRLEDGRYNLLLAGLCRVRIMEELAPTRSFRQAKVRIVDDLEPATNPHFKELTEQLLDRFQSHMSNVKASESLSRLLADGVTLSMLTDLVAYALPLDAELKQKLLMEPCVATRAQLLLKHIPEGASDETAPAARPSEFPPPFSDN